MVDKEIARAFELWSNVTPLNFIPKSEGKVHIDIKFVAGDHGDGNVLFEVFKGLTVCGPYAVFANTSLFFCLGDAFVRTFVPSFCE